jgi:hypothetical protein
LPENVGYVGDKDHDALVKQLEEVYIHWLGQLSPRFKEMASDTRLYLGYREDRRQAHEKWRSWSWLGDPYQQTETEMNAWLEIMNSTDPSFAVEGVGPEDEWKARGISRQIDYILRGNKWTSLQEMLFRDLSPQGWKVIKTGWKEIKFSPMRRPTKDELITWDKALNEALKTGTVSSPPDPMTEQPEFQSWMQQTQQLVPGFPSAPAPAPSEVVTYRGPGFDLPSSFDLAFDPHVEKWENHELIFHRIVKPREWGEKRVEEGKFDKQQFEKSSRSGPNDSRLSQYDRQISEQIGVTVLDNDPRWKNSDEYLEIWRPFNDKAPYLVMLNRSAFVNVSTVNPHWHRQHPYTCIKNVPITGHAVGLGSYAQIRRTFQDRLTFRDLMLDGLLLSVMPVFLKSRSMGMTELHRFLKPGMILETNDPKNALVKGWESMPGFSELLRVGQELMNDQNQILSTGENVRGQTSTVGRVSATESQGRLTQALVRHKKKAERLEEELSGILPQALELVYQHMPSADPKLMALRAQIIGEDERDALVNPEFTWDTFAEALNMNIKFRGATSKLNKELVAQQLKDFLATASQIQSMSGIPVPIMTPEEARNVMRRMFDALGQKGAGQIFTPAGDQAVQSMLQAHMIAAQTAPVAAQVQGAQVQQQLQAIQNPQPAQAEPPSRSLNYKDTPPDIQRQLEQQAGLQPSALGNQPNPALQPAQPGGPSAERV